MIFILQTGGGLDYLVNLMPFILLILVIYLFFLRPQMRKQKAQMSFVQNLKKGDEVVTGSGIIGRVNKIESKAVTLQLDSKTFIKVMPTAVSKEMTDSYHKASDAKS